MGSFGGIPIESAAASGGSFGGIPVESASQDTGLSAHRQSQLDWYKQSDYGKAHPDEVATFQKKLQDDQEFEKNHPYFAGFMRAFGSDPTPVPGLMDVPGSVADPLVTGVKGALGGAIKGAVEGAHKLPIVGKVLDAIETPLSKAVQGFKSGYADGAAAARSAQGPSSKWAGPAPEAAPLPEATPIPGKLPSGRVVGRPAFDTTTGEMLTGDAAQGHFVGKPAPSTGGVTIPQQAAGSELPADIEAQRAMLQGIDTKVEGTPIDTTKVSVLPARATTGGEGLAKAWADDGITAAQADKMNPKQIAQYGDFTPADAAKARKLLHSIEDMKDVSPAQLDRLKKTGALDIARQLQEAMK